MWSLQREETLSFDLTSKGMCLLFGAACPAAPWGSRASKLGWQGQRQLFLRDELSKKEGKHFWQKSKIPMLFFHSILQMLVEVRAPSLFYHIFLFQNISHCPCDKLYLILKNAKTFEPRGTAVIAEFTALELIRTQIWYFLWLTPLSDTRSRQCPGMMLVQS